MKIGFDAKRAVQNYTGLGNYSRYIIDVLSEYYPGNDYLLFAPRQQTNERLHTILSRGNAALVCPRGIARLFAPLWRLSGIKKDIRERGIELYHGLSNELPLGLRHAGLRTVVTIHDLIFLRYPRYYPLVDRMIYRIKFRLACRDADRIIAASECTKRDIVSFFRIPAHKIEVVYQGCHPAFYDPAGAGKRQSVAAKYRLPPLFLLTVGSIEARKNLALVVKALPYISGEIHLVAIGKPTPYQREVEQYARKAGLTPRLHLLNDVTFEDLPAIYQLASLCIYPSLFEGFGIPVVEALASGVPVIAATGSCLEEAGGPGSIYVDPSDEKALSEHITAVLNNKEMAQRMTDIGKEYVKRFSGRRIASEVMRIYTSVQ